jgi:Polysaccharide lyase
VTMLGRTRSDTATRGDSALKSDHGQDRPHGLARRLVIAVSVAVLAGGVALSARETRPVATSPSAPLTSLLDYQTSDFTQWTEQHLHRSEQEAIVTSPARTGFPQTARFVVAPGDHTGGRTGVERAEVMASIAQTGNPAQGRTMWFAWSTFIPAGTHVDSNATSPVGNGWLVFSQWHGTASSGPGPNIAFSLTKGTATPRLILATNGGSGSGTRSEWVQPTALPLGRWVDFVVGITWGTSSSVGRMTVRVNGTTWLNNAPCANLYPGQSAYFKQGIYRASSRQTQTIYHTGTRIGPTEGSVTRATGRTSR